MLWGRIQMAMTFKTYCIQMMPLNLSYSTFKRQQNKDGKQPFGLQVPSYAQIKSGRKHVIHVKRLMTLVSTQEPAI